MADAPQFTLPPLEEIQAELQTRSLSRFIRDGWPHIDPDPYYHNWHIDAISEHLEAVNRGEITRLLLNFPPRHMKSITVSVGWPAWTWAGSKAYGPYRGPQVRFLAASYAQTLSVRDSVKCRRLIESPWYQQQFGSRFRITSDQNTKIRFDNNKGGYRIATSVEGSATGEGGDIIVIDDPHNAAEIHSVVKRESTVEWWRSTMSTRLNQTTGAFVVVMQRLHERDLSGYVLEQEEGWTHLCLPARYERKHPYVWLGDPRTKEGELLWPERFSEEALSRMEQSMGSYTAAGQLQQRPAPREGGMFQRDWFEIVEAAPADVMWVRYWDLAGTDEVEGGDPAYTSGVLFGKSKSTKVYYVKHVHRVRYSGLKTEQLLRTTASQDGRDVTIGLPQDPGQAGKDQYQRYVRLLSGYHVRRFIEGSEGSKPVRALPLSAQAEARNVKLVRGPWNQAWLDEIELFPNGTFLDQTDATVGAFWVIEKAPPIKLVAPTAVPMAVPAGYRVRD